MSAFTYATNSPYVLKVIWKQLQLNSVQPTQSNQIYEWREHNSYICITVAA